MTRAEELAAALGQWGALAPYLDFEARGKYDVAVHLKPCVPGPRLWVTLHVYNTDTRKNGLGWTQDEILIDALKRAQALVDYHKQKQMGDEPK